MRILLLNQFYPPDTAATGQLLADVATSLADAGHEVHVVCSCESYGRQEISSAHKAPIQNGVRIHRVNASGLGRTRFLGRLCDWSSYYCMAALHGLRLGKFDGCLALTTPPFIGEIGVALKQLRGTRLTLWAMDLWPQVAEAVGTLRSGGCLSLALTALARRMYKRADAIISLGQFMSQRLVALGVSEEKIITVHNWVPSEAVTPQPSGQKFLEAYGPFDGRFVIMYSGNMGMPHEFETILAAADLLKNEPALAFVFVGDGKRRQEVVQETRRRGLSNVAFMAPVPLERLSSLLGAAHVHLVSLRPGLEGFVVPSKVYGILAAARPAIMVGSTQNEVAQLLLDAGAGFVVRSGQAEELAEAIRTLHAHPDLASKMGQAGRRYYGEHLGRDRSVSAIMKAVTHSPCPRRQEGRTT